MRATMSGLTPLELHITKTIDIKYFIWRSIIEQNNWALDIQRRKYRNVSVIHLSHVIRNHMNPGTCRPQSSSGSRGPRAPRPPLPRKISHKKDDCQRRLQKFHVSGPPLPIRWISYCKD